MEAGTLDGADRADGTPSWGRYLMLAMLIVWALIFVAVVLTEPYVDVLIAMLIVSALIVVATVLIGHYPIIGTLTVALGVVAIFVGLFFLRNALREECGFSGGTPPSCDLSYPVSNAPGP